MESDPSVSTTPELAVRIDTAEDVKTDQHQAKDDNEKADTEPEPSLRNAQCMTFIQDGLYLGDVDAACCPEILQPKGITHILTVNQKPPPKEITSAFVCKFISALDMEHVDLLSEIPEAISFIDEGRKVGGVLVHCYAGQSRSAMILIAYLMTKMSLSLDEAMQLLRKYRPQVCPNPGFTAQLRLYESMGNTVDRDNGQYKLYRLNNLVQLVQAAQLVDISVHSFSADPCNTPLPGVGMSLYKCKKCRRPLFKSTSQLHHSPGAGEAAFDWRAPKALNNDDEDACTESLFIEPVQWMGEEVLQTSGKLGCPKCGIKLGSFSWSGKQCSCGSWVTPAFHVHRNKVDECRVGAVPPQKSSYSESAAGERARCVPSRGGQEYDEARIPGDDARVPGDETRGASDGALFSVSSTLDRPIARVTPIVKKSDGDQVKEFDASP